MGFLSRAKRKPNSTTNGAVFRKLTHDELKSFRESAETFRLGIAQTFGENLDYDRPSLDKLDNIIEEGWHGATPEQLPEVVASFGSFLGETLARIHDGEWAWDGAVEEYCVTLKNGVKPYPFVKVMKRFTNGKGDSISFYLIVLDKELGGSPPADGV